MKTFAITYFTASLALTVSCNARAPKASLDDRLGRLGLPKDTAPTHLVPKTLVTRADDPAVAYHKASCKGQKLLSATVSPHNLAAAYVQPIDSPWIGPFVPSLITWGYSMETDYGDPQWRATHFDECELATNHRLRPMCDALGIDTRSTYQGGPNRCYYVAHRNGPAVLRDTNGRLPPVNQQYYNVNGYQYRITNAEFTIGLNVPAGLMIITNTQSPATSAKDLWGLASLPPNSLLPPLRSTSDIMFGLWSMASGQWVHNINRFLITPIVNDNTVSIIENILEQNFLDPDDLMGWPGLEFTAHDPEYKPLLGSPNGQAIGFFLAQHKRQLGGKYISKINVFKGDTDDALAICMLLTVADLPSAAEAESNIQSNMAEGMVETVVLKQSDDGKNVIRRHTVWSQA